MTTTTGLYGHTPIVATGKTRAFASVTATEGSASLGFTNTGSPLITGDDIFVSTTADAGVQYMGLATAHSAAGVTCQFISQESIAGTGKVWTPTSSMKFEYAYSPGAYRENFESGTRLFVSRGNAAYSIQFQDIHTTFRLNFNPLKMDDWVDWTTFILTTRSAGTKPFSIALWHPFQEKSLTYQVRADMANLSVTTVDKVVASFSQSFFIVASDTYDETA